MSTSQAGASRWPARRRPPPSASYRCCRCSAASYGRTPPGASRATPDALVFATRSGAKIGASNVRRRILAPAVEKANERLAKQDAELLPEGLTPHSMRRTCATIHVALGWDPSRVMRLMGHTDAAFTLSVYSGAVDWAEGEADRLRALVEGGDWVGAGISAAEKGIEGIEREAA